MRITKSLLATLSVMVVVAMPILAQAGEKSGEREEGRYLFLYANSFPMKNSTAYFSKIIFFPGYSKCLKIRDYEFSNRARDAFSNYLKNKEGVEWMEGYAPVKYITETLGGENGWNLDSMSKAKETMDYMVKNEKETPTNKGIIFTNFTYSCNEAKR